MTAALDLHPDTRHPAVAGVSEIHRVLDTIDAAVALTAGDYAALVREVDRAVRRLQSVKLQLVAAADAASVASHSGLTGTGAWLAKQTRTTGATAARQVALAGALTHLPATQSALGVGEVSPAHAGVIAEAMGHLPDALTVDERLSVEHNLVEQAKSIDPASLRKRARRALEVVASKHETDRHEATRLRDEESAARARTRLTMHDNGDGTTSGHFTVPNLAADILRKVVQQIASPRRARLGAARAQAGSPDHTTDWAHRNGLALVEVLEHLPTDRLHHKVAATIVVTLQKDQLFEDLAGAGCDTGHHLSPGDARRMACNAGLLPAILDGPSLPLDLGRTHRFFSNAQQVALSTRHRTCIADGCDRPFAWCELHHQDPWARGGPTDLDRAEPLCGFHHHRVHDPAYRHTRAPDGAITFHRRT